MSSLKNLASQTAVYGLSSILGRTLNFLLVPIHTRVLGREAYGINTDLYTYIAFLMIVLTFGMETAFFRFAHKKGADQNRVFTTAFVFIASLSSLFLLLMTLNFNSLTMALRYEDLPYLLWITLGILLLDVWAALPFARLRAQNRAKRFALVRLSQIGLTVLLNLFVFLALPLLHRQGLLDMLPPAAENPNGVTYIFIINLIASSFMIMLLLPQLRSVSFQLLDRKLLRQMLVYSSPLVLAGLAGTVNEMLDRQMIKYLLPKETSMQELGVYGAVYKISIFMTLFIQAFRYAAEPFFFQSAEKDNSREIYARVLKYFVFAMGFILFGIVAFIDVVKHFIGEEFQYGIFIVPILLLANLFLGIQVNLSIWYKVSDKTLAGALISSSGAIITIVLNLILIPKMGFTGAAWTTLICYVSLSLITYVSGQIIYPIPYETAKILIYILLATGFATLSFLQFREMVLPNIVLGALLISSIYLLDQKNIQLLISRFR